MVDVSPSPNSQSQVSGSYFDRSENWTVNGVVPVAGLAEKSAIGRCPGTGEVLVGVGVMGPLLTRMDDV